MVSKREAVLGRAQWRGQPPRSSRRADSAAVDASTSADSLPFPLQQINCVEGLATHRGCILHPQQTSQTNVVERILELRPATRVPSSGQYLLPFFTCPPRPSYLPFASHQTLDHSEYVPESLFSLTLFLQDAGEIPNFSLNTTERWNGELNPNLSASSVREISEVARQCLAFASRMCWTYSHGANPVNLRKVRRKTE